MTPCVRPSGCAFSPSSTVTQRSRLGTASGAVEEGESCSVQTCGLQQQSRGLAGHGKKEEETLGDSGWSCLTRGGGRRAGLGRWESSEPTHSEAPVMPSTHQILGRANERMSCTCVKMQPPAAGGQTLSPLGVSQQAQPSKLRKGFTT